MFRLNNILQAAEQDVRRGAIPAGMDGICVALDGRRLFDIHVKAGTPNILLVADGPSATRAIVV